MSRWSEPVPEMGQFRLTHTDVSAANRPGPSLPISRSTQIARLGRYKVLMTNE
jgi:hypothetical protein